MIDLHAHVLPRLDDGPRTLGRSIALAEAAAGAGTRTIVATPHVNARYATSSAAIRLAVPELNAALHREGVALTVLAGAEIALERLLDLRPAELDRLGLGGGRHLLIEPPFRVLAGDFEWPIRRLLDDKAHGVVIAHPERCAAFARDPGRLRRLVEAGALVQLTTGSLTGRFGPMARDAALTFAREGLVHNLASDMHDLDARGPSLRDGIAVLADYAGVTAAQAAWLTTAVPQAIVEGVALPPRP